MNTITQDMTVLEIPRKEQQLGAMQISEGNGGGKG